MRITVVLIILQLIQDNLCLGATFLRDAVDTPPSAEAHCVMEAWKPIAGYEGYYEVSNSGTVRGLERIIYPKNRPSGIVVRSRIMKTFNCGKKHKDDVGYKGLVLSKGGEKWKVMMHQLVGVAFVPNPLNLPCINHLDGNKQNNFDWNLEWTTYSDNNQHAFDTGLKVAPEGAESKIFIHGRSCKGTPKNCLWCGVHFTPIFEKGIYCSRSCKSLHQHAKA